MKFLRLLLLLPFATGAFFATHAADAPHAANNNAGYLGWYTEPCTTSGFYWAIDLNGAYSIRLKSYKHNFTLAEMTGSAGYKFNQYVSLGVGAGYRHYIGPFPRVKGRGHHYSIPVFVDSRGNFIDQEGHRCVPCWGMEVGGAFHDGFLCRPQAGVKWPARGNRPDVRLCVTWTMQTMNTIDRNHMMGTNLVGPFHNNEFVHFVGLNLGVQF